MTEQKILTQEATKVWGGLLPKVETQSSEFLKQHPEMDGRGVIVGVLDTGVDPGAAGLQTTTEGLPKIIDIIDCTGSGDVAMSGPHQVDESGHLKGASGRSISINPSWKNPSGNYFVGMKKLSELYTSNLRNRMKLRRQEDFDLLQKQQEKIVQEKVAGSSEETKEDLSAQLKALREMGSENRDGIGPVLDCIVFHDGEKFMAAIDCTLTGDMSSIAPLSDFSHNKEFRTFSKEDCFNYGVHIYDEGKILSIVVDSGAHGTHVAGIIAAHHPDDPEINGVAPGAQIVSLKIGDSRVDSGETAPGLIRALLEAIRLRCNVINMSFGEAAQFDNTGAFKDLAEEMVYKHGITFISSAGNNGPNISTVGAPMASCIISVGAFVTKSLMKTAYSINESNMSTIPECNFTWSSVGPVADGDMGVSLMAPGGATTCVPNWTLNRYQLMNGTSMSSPNACGCFALLLSGLKQNSDPSSKFIVPPSRLRTAVENSCKYVEEVDVLGQNNGLIQVKNAWNHIQSNMKDSSLDIPIRFEVLSRRFSRGIYLRHKTETSVVSTFKVEIKPAFSLLPDGKDSDDIAYFGGRTIQQAKIGYEMRLRLESSCSWVIVPENALLVQSGKIISVQVDPTDLPAGVHVEFIRGFDESNPKKGCVFKIPVTVVQPEVIPPHTTSHVFGSSISLPPSQRVRRFIVPPPGCSYMDVVVKDKRQKSSASEDSDCDSSSRMVVVHALQLLPGEPYRDHEKQSYLHLSPGSEHCVSFAVEANIPLELTLSRFWSTLGEVVCDVTVYFKGVSPTPSRVYLSQGQKVNPACSRVRLQADLHPCSVLPRASLSTWSRTILPNAPESKSASRVSPLGERDVLPNGNSVYQLVLEYSFEVEENKHNVVTPTWPVWNQVLYESPFTGQLFMIYDSEKQLMGCGDAYPDRSSVTLSKGHYTIRLQVRHNDASLLEKYDKTPLVLERKLDAPVKVPCYSSQADALLDKPVSAVPLFLGTSTSVVFGEPAASDLPSTALAGDVFKGEILYLSSDTKLSGHGCKPGGYDLIFSCTNNIKQVLASPPAKSLKNEAELSTDEKNVDSDADGALFDAVREAKLKFLSEKLSKSPSLEVLLTEFTAHPFHKAYSKMKDEYPVSIPLRLSFLDYAMKCISASLEYCLDKSSNESDLKSCCQSFLKEGMSVADEVIDMLDKTAIASELGVLLISSDNTAVKRRAKVNTMKEQLITALAFKCRAQVCAFKIDDCRGSIYCNEDFDASFNELSKWEDISKSKSHWDIFVHKNSVSKRYGLCLQRINEVLLSEKQATSPSSSLIDELRQSQLKCLKDLGWIHIVDRLAAKKDLIKGSGYQPF